MTVTNKISRRRLLGQAMGAALAGITLPACNSSTNQSASESDDRPSGPNEQIGVGMIGCGRRNMANLPHLNDVAFAFVVEARRCQLPAVARNGQRPGANPLTLRGS